MISRGKEVTKAKVDDFDVAGFADQYVFDFQVSMNDAVSVTVV
jgi:hypothetical protein